MSSDPSGRDLLPLPLTAFHILISLGNEARHGYAIIQDVAERTGGDVRIAAGTLYRSLQRMSRQGLIEEVGPPGVSSSADKRRRYYRITGVGREAARAEAARLQRLLRLARSTGFPAAPA